MAITITTKTLNRLQPKQMTIGASMDASDRAGFGAVVMDKLLEYVQQMQAKGARRWREEDVWAARCVQLQKDRVANAEHSIRPENPEESYDAEAIDEMMTLLDRPNPQLSNDSFGGLHGMVIEDLLTINRGCIQKLLLEPLPGQSPYDLIQPYALRAIDGALVTFIDGWEKPEDGPRYKIDQGRNKPPIHLNNNQMIVMDASPTTYSSAGISPFRVLQRFLSAELATFRRMHLNQIQNTAGGVFMVPGANPGTPDALNDEYETNIQNNSGVVFMNIPADSKYVEIGSPSLDLLGTFKVYEILVRGMATAFGIPPMMIGWYADVNKGYGEVAEGINDDGIVTLLKLIRHYHNAETVPCWGPRANNLVFTFDQLEVEDESEASDSLRTKAGDKDFIRVSEVRTAAGLEEIRERDVPPAVWPFLNELWVPTPVGRAVVKLPWTYFLRFSRIDPQTTEFMPDSPLLPQPPSALTDPGQLALPDSGGNGAVDPEALDTLAAVTKRLSTIRKTLETSPSARVVAREIDELEAISDLIMANMEDYVPEEDEEQDAADARVRS